MMQDCRCRQDAIKGCASRDRLSMSTRVCCEEDWDDKTSRRIVNNSSSGCSSSGAAGAGKQTTGRAEKDWRRPTTLLVGESAEGRRKVYEIYDEKCGRMACRLCWAGATAFCMT